MPSVGTLPQPREQEGVETCSPGPFKGKKQMCVCISVAKAPPIFVSIDSAFVLQGKGKQLDDIIMGINTMTAINDSTQ